MATKAQRVFAGGGDWVYSSCALRVERAGSSQAAKPHVAIGLWCTVLWSLSSQRSSVHSLEQSLMLQAARPSPLQSPWIYSTALRVLPATDSSLRLKNKQTPNMCFQATTQACHPPHGWQLSTEGLKGLENSSACKSDQPMWTAVSRG